MDCLVQPQNSFWTGAIPHGLPNYHHRNYFPNFYFPRKRTFCSSFYPGAGLFFPHDNDVDHPNDMKADLATGISTMPLFMADEDLGEMKMCVVCSERASGFYFGALVCLPCKSFYIRCTKDGEPTFTCQCSGNCDVVNKGRIRCQYCRYQRCLMAGMCRKEKPETVQPAEGQVLCKVCGDIANGIHFGVNTCEGCKKFFRRGLVEHQSYTCKGEKECGINPRNRNNCRYCRYQKCLAVGMSREAIKMGRPKKADGSDASGNSASSQKISANHVLDTDSLSQHSLTNPQLGDDSKSASVPTTIKEEFRPSCDYNKLASVWDQNRTHNPQWHSGNQSVPPDSNCENRTRSHTNNTSEFIEEEMNEILLFLENDDQSEETCKRGRYDNACKTEYDNGLSGQQWQSPSICNQPIMSPGHPSSLSVVHPSNMSPVHQTNMSPVHPSNMSPVHPSNMPPVHPFNISPVHRSTISPAQVHDMSPMHVSNMSPMSDLHCSSPVHQIVSRPPPQYPGYNSFQPDQIMSIGVSVSPSNSPTHFQMVSPNGYISDTSVHSPEYVNNGSSVHSRCQYSPQHSPIYHPCPSPESHYNNSFSPRDGTYTDMYHQNLYSSVTDRTVNAGCRQPAIMDLHSPPLPSPSYNGNHVANTSASLTIPNQERGVCSHDNWCIMAGSPSHYCNNLSQTVPNQESLRHHSRIENLQRINAYFISPSSPSDLQLIADPDMDGKVSRSDIEGEIVRQNLEAVSPAEPYYYVLSDIHACPNDSVNYDDFTSCQRINKRKSFDDADVSNFQSAERFSGWRCKRRTSEKYWQASACVDDIYLLTADSQAILEHLSKLYQQLTEISAESIKSIPPKDGHVWQTIQLRIARNTSAAVKFASQIPGFSGVHHDDKIFLCKSVAFMSTLLIAGHQLYSPAENNFRDFWNWQITPQNPFYLFKQQLLELGKKIHASHMDLYEVSTLCALLFVATDFTELSYPEAIENAREKIITALISYELSKGIDVRSRLSQLFGLVPEIRHIGTWHQELMKQMKINVQMHDVHKLFDTIEYRES